MPEQFTDPIWLSSMGFFALATGYQVFRFSQFLNMTRREDRPPRHEYRRRGRRMLEGAGVWEISIGVAILAGPGPISSGAIPAFAVIAVGLMILVFAWSSAKFESLLGGE